jgi:hypothetical protein
VLSSCQDFPQQAKIPEGKKIIQFLNCRKFKIRKTYVTEEISAYSFWGHTPMLVYIPFILVLMSRPWTNAVPEVGFVRPIICEHLQDGFDKWSDEKISQGKHEIRVI